MTQYGAAIGGRGLYINSRFQFAPEGRLPHFALEYSDTLEWPVLRLLRPAFKDEELYIDRLSFDNYYKAALSRVDADSTDMKEPAIDPDSSVLTLAHSNCNSLRRRCWDGTLRSYLRKVNADILFFTEVKSSFHNLLTFPGVMQMFDDFGFLHRFWNEATLPNAGYSGVAMCSKIRPLNHCFGLGDPSLDCEGRTFTAAFPHFTVVLSYVPCTGMFDQFTEKRKSYNAKMRTHLTAIQRTTDNVIWLGDLNVAHLDNDAYAPDLNLPGTLKWERDDFQKTLTEHNLVDAYKHCHPTESEHHMTYYENKRYSDTGYGLRLDYMLVTPSLLPHVVDTAVIHPYRGSDHLPMSLTLRLPKVVLPYPEDRAVPMIFGRRGYQRDPPDGLTWTSSKPPTELPMQLPKPTRKRKAAKSQLMTIVASVLSLEMVYKLRNLDSQDAIAASSLNSSDESSPSPDSYSSILHPEISTAQRLEELEHSCNSIQPLGHRAVVEDFLLDTCSVSRTQVKQLRRTTAKALNDFVAITAGALDIAEYPTVPDDFNDALTAALYMTQRHTAESYLATNGYSAAHIRQTRTLTNDALNLLLSDLADGLGLPPPPILQPDLIVSSALAATSTQDLTMDDYVSATAGAIEVPYLPLDFTLDGDSASTPFTTLADSGATFSLVSARTLQARWGSSWRDKVRIDKDAPTLKMANGTVQSTSGYVHFNVAYKGTLLHKQKFTILPDLPVPFILGVDFMTITEAQLDFKKDTIYLPNHKLTLDFKSKTIPRILAPLQLQASTGCVIPPLCSKFINSRCSESAMCTATELCTDIPQMYGFVDPYHELNSVSHLQTSKSHTYLRHGATVVMVANNSATDYLHIKTGDIVGTFEPQFEDAFASTYVNLWDTATMGENPCTCEMCVKHSSISVPSEDISSDRHTTTASSTSSSTHSVHVPSSTPAPTSASTLTAAVAPTPVSSLDTSASTLAAAVAPTSVSGLEQLLHMTAAASITTRPTTKVPVRSSKASTSPPNSRLENPDFDPYLEHPAELAIDYLHSLGYTRLDADKLTLEEIMKTLSFFPIDDVKYLDSTADPEVGEQGMTALRRLLIKNMDTFSVNNNSPPIARGVEYNVHFKGDPKLVKPVKMGVRRTSPEDRQIISDHTQEMLSDDNINEMY
jgi:exodeoxyribonuclease III